MFVVSIYFECFTANETVSWCAPYSLCFYASCCFFLVINFQSEIIGPSPTTVLIKTSNGVSGISIFSTLFIVGWLEVCSSLQIMNIRNAFPVFNRFSSEIFFLFTLELRHFLRRKREFIRSKTLTIKRIHLKFVRTFDSLLSIVLCPFSFFQMKFRSLYKL
jgi:hypothetical protein